ncbi:MAG: hypothetical protein QOJ36_524 [Verrucomicrobiota bacterium]
MTGILDKLWTNRQRVGFDFAFFVLIAIALINGIKTTAGVAWPYDLDQFRDIGMAQAILDHRYGTDHLYLGETIWYNPLVSAIVAVISSVGRIAPPVVVTQAGAYLNLFAPIAFYILVTYLFDRLVALAAVAAFLFAPIGDAPSWAAATYSPWIFSQNLAQGFFYLTLVAYCKAIGSNQWRWHLIVGILLGITFLGHTAPAVILGMIMFVGLIMNPVTRSQVDVRSVLFRKTLPLLLILVAAFIVSLPFTLSILFHYHLRILNPVPSNWIYSPLAIDKLPDFLRRYLSWFSAIAALGLVVLIGRRSGQAGKIALLTWLMICCAALAVNELQQITSPQLHLMFVPAHHFLFYLRALENILFGIGLVWACRFLARGLSSLFRKRQNQLDHFRREAEVAFVALAVAAFLILVYPKYRDRFDFTNARSQAVSFAERKTYLDAYRWILANTKPVDVFLSLNGDLDLSIVGPADRKVVVISQPEFSNPYVDWKSRFNIASQVVDKLTSAPSNALAALAANGVNYIITAPIDQFDRDPFSFLSKEFAEDDVIIYKVRSESAR